MFNRKAITPVIAVVLLLMMTVAAAGAAFFWMTTIQSRIQGQIGTQVSETTLTTTTTLNIVNVICNASPGMVNITIQNTGSNTIVSGTSALTITDTQDRVLKTATTTSPSFAQNEIITINYTIGEGVITAGTTYGVKITLPGGAEQTTDCIAQ